MKSRDELSLDMARVICPAVSTEKCVNGACPKLWDCPVKISIFEKLVDKGYGDVSEYKAEIKRLNSHNGFLQSVISHSKDMLDEAVKQAQIDVLNKLKERLDSAPNGWAYTGYIDELIEETEKQ